MANEPKPAKQTFFNEVDATFRSPKDQARRNDVLTAGIATARWRAHQLWEDLTKKKAPGVTTIRNRYITDAGLETATANSVLRDNPLMYIPADFFEHAYRSWASSGGTGIPPWELLAIEVKEGWNANPKLYHAPTYRPEATSEEHAKDLFRSEFYFQSVGLDYFIYHEAQKGGDNTTSFDDDKAQAHHDHFIKVANQLISGIAEQINATLLASPDPSGRGYNVTVTARFYELTLRLTDAYFRQNVKGVPGGHFGLSYMRWNQGQGRFRDFMKAAEQHMKEPGNTAKIAAEWAFKTKIKTEEYGKSRMSALTVMYFADVYRMAFEDIDWTKVNP